MSRRRRPGSVTAADARRRVSEVADCASDEDVAHSKEDDLWADVLATIFGDIKTLNEARELARLALSTRDVKFQRHCA